MSDKSITIVLLQCAFLPFLWVTAASAESSIRDREIENFLRNARVVQIHEMIASTSYPMSLDLELNGRTGMAVFKYNDSGRVPGESANADQSLPHAYRYEVAAYRLDRMLNLHMVPTAVIRTVKKEGALVEWITEGKTLKALRASGKPVADPRRLTRQHAVMNLFDALILNPNREDTDQLIIPRSSKLHLIDHGQAFGISTTLPKRFTAKPARLPRDLLKQLVQLDEGNLKERLAGLLTDDEISALMRRRDAILHKITADRKRYGKAKIFQD